ncbi:MAG: response regulator [gamma proteobacterium symbiont of Taylorina sp.]|nr:response regulator [gamma proteobacterium symbiont of Taylorina sp.]
MNVLNQYIPTIKNKVITRIGVLFLLTLLVSVSIIGYFGYDNARQAYVKNSIDKSQEDVDKLTSTLDAYLSSSIPDLKFLNDFYALRRYIEWHDIGEMGKVERWKNMTNNAFESFLYSKKRYARLRFIGSDGQERIRLDYDDTVKKVNIVAENRMQNKKHRHYFIRTMAQGSGTIFVSPFDLNREFGRITYPHEPTLRFSMPMIDRHGDHKGIIVINLLGDRLIELIRSFDKKVAQDNYYLLNKKGYFLYHPDQSKMFGFDLGSDETFEAHYPVAFAEMMEKDKGTLIENGQVISYHRIYPGGAVNEHYLLVVNTISQHYALQKLRDFELAFIGLSLLILVAIIFLMRKLYYTLSPLQIVSEQLGELAIGNIPDSRISYDSNDEVGQIVNSTKVLIESIRSTILQANAIAEGDFSKEILIHSEDDQLNQALNAMTRRLRTIAELSDAIARGETGRKLKQSGENDQLAESLNRMINYLDEISKITNAIAIGDFSRDFSLRGGRDELGRSINQMLDNLREVLQQTAQIADGDFHTVIKPRSDNDQLSAALIKMTSVLESNKKQAEKENFIKDGISELNRTLSSDIAAEMIAKESITHLCRYLQAASGVIYYYDEKNNNLRQQASFAFSQREKFNNRIVLGEGVVGQVALEQEPILLQSVTRKDYSIETGMHSTAPAVTYTFALLHEKNLIGVAEVASLNLFSEAQIELMNQAASVIATFVMSSEQNSKIKELLDKSQRDYEETQMKSEELQQTNVQMEEQAQQLQMQAKDMKEQNLVLTVAKADLDKQAKELKLASQYKSEFLANMSHELRTPLNSIILLSKMLRDGLENKEQGKKAEVIHNAGNDLLLLINDILDLSKIEAGQMELNIVESSSTQISQSLQELFNPIAEDRGLEFIIHDELNSSFEIDVTKVMQVLKNLLSNAFKFTKKGSVTLHLYSKNEQLNFAVSDTGIGIAQDKLEHIFGAFKQVDGTITREYGGTGLGLSISLRFAELLNGKLIVESIEEQGSLFLLSIPGQNLNNKQSPSTEEEVSISNSKSELLAVDAAEKMHEDEIEYSKKHRFEGNTLLLVDDDSRNIFTLSALFQDAGAQTLHALNGQEALDLLNDESDAIDLILMDIMMPKMDGYEAIERIRQNKKYINIPIIAVTAKAMNRDKQKCLDIGANDYVTKPINEKTLMQLSRLWIDKMGH